MLINAIDPEESRIAVVEDGVLQELHVELANREAYLGNIYKGKVVNIEPSIGAAFVAFGGRVNGFLHVSDVLPAYGRPDFRLEDVIEGRARVDAEDGPESLQQALDDDEADDADETGSAADREPDARAADEASKAEADAGEADERGDAAADEAEPADAGAATVDELDDHEAGEEAGEVEIEVGDIEVGDSGDVEGGEPGSDAADDDDDDDDDSFGFGDGLGEKPMLMAARGGDGDEVDGDGGDGEVADPRSADARSTDTPSPDTQGAGAEIRPFEAADDEASGEDPVADKPKKKRTRKKRTKKAKAGDEDLVRDEDSGAADEVAADRSEAAEPARDAEAEADGGGDEPETEGRKRRSRRRRKSADGDRDVDGDGGAGRREARKDGGASQQSDGKGRSRRGGASRRGKKGGKEGRSSRPRMSIDQLLKKGQEVVVQITKEGIGNKGPTLTTYVSLPGRCLVLMPSLPKCGVSRKIEDARERKRLKRIVRELDETGSGGIGFIVRTAGINKSQEDLHRDRDYLKKIWELVAQRLKVTRAPSLLYQESDLVLKAMRDQFTRDIADVVVDSEDVFMRIRDFAEKLMPHLSERIKQHSVTTPLFHHFGIESEVEKLYQPQIDISNGASIVIDQTEALVAIDVNSGKYKAGHDSDDTAYKTNLEAIPEIVRQLRLRDLGGLIIIDFIDMMQEKHRRGVERRMIDSLRGDRARIKVGRISPFGMLEITRQRVGPGLKRTVFMQCPHCKGSGWSRTVQSKALSVLRETRALLHLKGYSILQVFVAPAVADYLVNHKRRGILELEDAVGKSIAFKPEQSYPIDVVHYRFMTGDGQEARVAIPAGLGVTA
ncbi:MAG: Rne/Rng family ribonuclease [bacterium]|nr:Rne/Rng family ribonuclease [bacterium]